METQGNDLWGVWRILCQYKKRYAKMSTIENENEIAVTFKEKGKIFIQQLFPNAPKGTDIVMMTPQNDEQPKHILTE